MSDLVSLRRGQWGNLLVRPSGLSRRVLISREALFRLETAQSRLPQNLQLMLRRGYEPGSLARQLVRRGARFIGAAVFCLLFPCRTAEASEIFGGNGHNLDGNHIDVALVRSGRRIRTLPLGVFSSPQCVRSNSSIIEIQLVWRELQAAGLRVHCNPTEALQIHCDLQ